MQKISSLLNNANAADAYVLGTIYAYNYQVNGKFLSVLCGKNQESTAHKIFLEDFQDQLNRAKKYYNDDRFDKYTMISDNPDVTKATRGAIGYFQIYENDLNSELEYKLNTLVENKMFSLNFIRGIIDSRSSGDKTADYISMDIKKKTSIIFVAILTKAFETVFDQKIQYNINPRFKQPSKISRLKNPQFRVPYRVVFGEIGTFRMQFFDKLKLNEKVYKKLKSNTIIPEKFDSIILWDTSNLPPYKPRVNNASLLEGDFQYYSAYSVKNEQIIYQKLREKFIQGNPDIKSKRKAASDDLKNTILKNIGPIDFLSPNNEIDTNKLGEYLLDYHHIVPYKFKYILDQENDIDDPLNFVPLRPDTHYFVHRGQMNEKKIAYLQKLFAQIQPFLEKFDLESAVTFDVFKSMY